MLESAWIGTTDFRESVESIDDDTYNDEDIDMGIYPVLRGDEKEDAEAIMNIFPNQQSVGRRQANSVKWADDTIGHIASASVRPLSSVTIAVAQTEAQPRPVAAPVNARVSGGRPHFGRECSSRAGKGRRSYHCERFCSPQSFGRVTRSWGSDGMSPSIGRTVGMSGLTHWGYTSRTDRSHWPAARLDQVNGTCENGPTRGARRKFRLQYYLCMVAQRTVKA